MFDTSTGKLFAIAVALGFIYFVKKWFQFRKLPPGLQIFLSPSSQDFVLTNCKLFQAKILPISFNRSMGRSDTWIFTIHNFEESLESVP